MPRRRFTPPSDIEPLFHFCRHCGGDYTPQEDGIEGVCPECAQRLYRRCDECGATVPAADARRPSSGRTLCRECAERLCYTCRECGGLHERSSFRKGSGESSSLLRPRVLQKRVQGPLARIIAFRTPPLIHPSLLKQPSRDVHVPTDGYHLPRCIRDNGPAGPRKVARRARNTKHDKRGERQMPDPGRQHRGRRAFRPQPNKLRS